MIGQIPGKRWADRCADPDCCAYHALRQIEPSSSSREIGNDQRYHDAQGRRRYPIKNLHGNKQIRVGHEGEERGSNWQRGECDEQEWTTSPNLSLMSYRGGDGGDDELRHHYASRDEHSGPFARAHREYASHERQHRRIREVKQQSAASEKNERTLVDEAQLGCRCSICCPRGRSTMC